MPHVSLVAQNRIEAAGNYEARYSVDQIDADKLVNYARLRSNPRTKLRLWFEICMRMKWFFILLEFFNDFPIPCPKSQLVQK